MMLRTVFRRTAASAVVSVSVDHAPNPRKSTDDTCRDTGGTETWQGGTQVGQVGTGGGTGVGQRRAHGWDRWDRQDRRSTEAAAAAAAKLAAEEAVMAAKVAAAAAAAVAAVVETTAPAAAKGRS